MSQGRHAIKILGLSLLAALGLMAVTAAAAQAGEFRVNGKTFTAAGVTTKAVLGEVPSGELLVGAGEGSGLNLTIHCEGGAATGTAKKGGIAENVSVTFEECEVLKNANCIIYPEEEEEGTAGTIVGSGSGTLILHGTAPNNHYITAANSNFTTVYFGGPKCTLPEENVIDGSIAIFLPTALSEVLNQVLRDISPATETLLGVALHFGGEKASIDVAEDGVAMLTSDENWGGE